MKLKACAAAFAILALLILAVLVLQAQAQTAKTATIKVAWDYENPPEDLAGFRLYQSDVSGQYTIGKGHEIATAKAADRTLTVSGITEGVHYWVLTAFDTEGNESPPSNEASKRIDKTPPGSPQNTTVEVEVFVNVSVGAQPGK
jgi:hypothetical protein